MKHRPAEGRPTHTVIHSWGGGPPHSRLRIRWPAGLRWCCLIWFHVRHFFFFHPCWFLLCSLLLFYLCLSFPLTRVPTTSTTDSEECVQMGCECSKSWCLDSGWKIFPSSLKALRVFAWTPRWMIWEQIGENWAVVGKAVSGTLTPCAFWSEKLGCLLVQHDLCLSIDVIRQVELLIIILLVWFALSCWLRTRAVWGHY